MATAHGTEGRTERAMTLEGRANESTTSRCRDIAQRWVVAQELNPELEHRAIGEILRKRGPGSLLDDLEKARSLEEHATEDVLHRGYIRFRPRRSRKQVSS